METISSGEEPDGDGAHVELSVAAEEVMTQSRENRPDQEQTPAKTVS